MTKLPQLRYREVEAILSKFNFRKIRQKGSHVFFSHRDGRTTVIPIHRKAIGKGLLHKIIKETKLKTEDFKK